MSQPNPSTPIHPLFVFLYDTERFFLDALKRSTHIEPTIHTKLKTAFQKFRNWGKANHTYLVAMADDLENSEVHQPPNYKGYQFLFWRFRKMWPDVCLVQQGLRDRAANAQASKQRTPSTTAGGDTAKTSSSCVQPPYQQQNPAPTPTSASAHDTTILFSRFKSPVMLPFAKWWAESQDKREGPLLPARSFEQAVERICSSISLIVDDWETEIAPILMPDLVQRELSGGGGP